MQNTIAKRLKAARGQAGLTQRQLADRLGIKDRQTVAAMEAGVRKVSADELLTAMKVLGRDLEYFTDPFRLEGEGSFSWRTRLEENEIGEFESTAGRWLALYRNLAEHDNLRTAPLRLDLTTKSSYEDAHRAAEWLANEWELGDVPAASLEDAIRNRLRALVLHVDAPEGVSGAAFKLPDFSAILINRNESAGRRTFDLAHELFHLLTWETITPAHSEDSGLLNPTKRGEQLANCFASALLMPESIVRKRWQHAPSQKDLDEWFSWLNELAHRFQVSVPALQWRFVQLGLLHKHAVGTTRRSDWEDEAETTPRLFSLNFLQAVNKAVDEGRISVRRVSSLIGLSIDDLACLFREYSLEVTFDV